MIDLKLSQRAKPGHGGILPGKKNTIEIANQIINGKTEAQEQIDIYNQLGFDGLKRFLVDNVEYKLI